MLSELNTQLFLILNGLAGQSNFSDSLFVVFATVFADIVFVAVMLGVFFHRDKESHRTLLGIPTTLREPVMVLGVSFLSGIGALILKGIFAIPRPFLVLPEAHKLIVYGLNDSFPSGHAMFFASLAVAVAIYHRRLGILLLALAFLIGVMRIIVGVHYPIDIIGGLVLGALLPLVARFFIHRLKRV